MTAMHPPAVALLLIVCLSSCELLDGSTNDALPIEPGVSKIYRGSFAQGFEDSIFEPCGTTEQWLIQFDDEETASVFQAGVLEVLGMGANPMYVRLRGTASAKGTYNGIFEVYDREFDVSEVLEIRATDSRDCR